MNWNLRKMEDRDVGSIVLLEQTCFSDPWSEKMVADLIDSSWDEVWVLEAEEDGVVGYINFRFIAGEGDLMRIAVLLNLRG